MMKLPKLVQDAIKNGPPIRYRDWRKLPMSSMTLAERAMHFGEQLIPLPDGAKVGQLAPYAPFQEAMYYHILDSNIWMLVVSMGRKNAKTQTLADVLINYLLNDELAEQNSNICLAANSRDQAGHLYNYMVKSLSLCPHLDGLYHVIPSQKKIIGLGKNVTLHCASADARNAHGGQYKVVVFDELAQAGIQSDFYDALVTGQGTQVSPKFLILSTQGATDGHLLSKIMDTAIKNNDPDVAVHLYAADEDCLLDDREQWKKANPAIGYFRQVKDIERQCREAMALGEAESRFRLLILNQRTSADQIWMRPSSWKANTGDIDLDVFRRNGAHIGLDLALVSDLSAAVLSSRDEDGIIHLLPICFTPTTGLDERVRKFKVPLDYWVREGLLITTPGASMDYDFISQVLKERIDDLGIDLLSLRFDRWKIAEFRRSCERTGFAQDCPWVEVGQGFKGMDGPVQHFEHLILEKRIRTGNNPLLNYAATTTVKVVDASLNSKLDKSKSVGAFTDPMVAAVMSTYGWEDSVEVDVACMIGGLACLAVVPLLLRVGTHLVANITVTA